MHSTSYARLSRLYWQKSTALLTFHAVGFAVARPRVLRAILLLVIDPMHCRGGRRPGE